MQKEVVPLSNIFSNRFDDLINSYDKKDVIYCRQTKNAITLLNIQRNRVAGYSKIKKETLGKNKVTDHSEIKEEVIKKNRVVSYSEIKKNIKNVNGDVFEISFFYQGIIKYN